MRLLVIFSCLLLPLLSLFSENFHPTLLIHGVNLVSGHLESSSTLHFETYQPGHNALGKEDLILSKKDFRIGRIRLIEVKNQPIPQFIYFYYTPNSTKIIERPDFATVYHYNSEGLVLSVEHYLKNENQESFYRRQRFFWDSTHPHALKSCVTEDTNGKPLLCHYFLYNEKGLLIQKSVAGQLSGKCNVPLIIEKTGEPLDNSIESYHIRYTYSDDENDFILSELEDNGCLTLYDYDLETKQCIRKTKGFNGEIFSDDFCCYGNEKDLFKIINEDEKSKEWQDLIGLSQYKIDEYQAEVNSFSLLDDKSQLEVNKDFALKNYFDEWNQCTATVDAYQNTTHYSYDSCGRLITKQLPRVLDQEDHPYHPVTTYSYNTLDQLISLCDPKEQVTTVSYNIRNQPLSIHYPDDTEENFIYFLDGKIKQKKTREGNFLNFKRDSASRLIQLDIENENGHILHQFFYTYQGNKIETLSDNQTFTYTFLYDELGQLKGKTYETKEGRRESKNSFAKDKEINDLKEWNLGKKETFKETNFSSQFFKDSSLYFYSSSCKNSLGQKVKHEERVDQKGVKEVKVYDALQRLETYTKWNAFGGKIKECNYRYDANGNLVKEVHTVLFKEAPIHLFTIEKTYDACNRLTSLCEKTEKKTKTTCYIYVKGKISEIIKPNRLSLYYLYNEKGQLSRWYASDHSLDYHYEYDTHGHLISCYDSCHQLSQFYTYNAFDELIEDRQSSFFSINYEYDSIGRRLLATFPDQTAIAYHYTDDLLSSIQRLSADQVPLYTHQNQYNKKFNLQKSNLIHDLGSVNYTFDTADLPVSIESNWGCQKIQMERTNQKTRVVEIQTTDNQGSFTSHYSYGDNEELIQENERNYDYDSLYNRLRQEDSQETYNEENQLIKNSQGQLFYDSQGCLIKQLFDEGEVVHFSYDAADRLIGVESPYHYKISYWYDTHHRRLGRRLKKWNMQSNSWSFEKVDHFIYDGQDEIGQLDEKGEIIALRILSQPQQGKAGSTIALEIEKKIYAPLHNIQGFITCLIDCENKTVAESYRYSAFGEEMIYDGKQNRLSDSAVKNPWRYAGKRKDECTHLIYFGRRDYSAVLGRWITPDPLHHVDTPNVYAYVKNDPINFYDPYGLFSIGNKWNQAVDILFKGFQYFQISSNQLPARLTAELKLPSSLVKSFERIGKYVLGESIYLLLGYDSDYTHISNYGKQEIHDKVRVTFINGMLTTHTAVLENLEMISLAHQGAKVHYVFRPTEGWTLDLLRAVYVRLGYYIGGFRSKHACLLAQLWKTMIEEMGGVEGGGTIIHYAHSLGGSETDRARGLLSEEEQKMIRVITLGSATFIRNVGFQNVKNLVSLYDPIPHLFEPLGSIRNFFDPNRNVYYHPSAIWGADHFLTGITYSNLIKQHAEEFLKEFVID